MRKHLGLPNAMKNTVIYHRADFDGIFCREIAKNFMPEAEYIGWDYGDPVPDVPQNTDLYMLDISVDGLMGHPRLIWIDHHKSAIEKFGNTMPGYRIDGVAACRLTYQWFLLNEAWDPREQLPPYVLPSKDAYINREVREPWAVRLAGEYDIWDKRDPDAELFQHGLRSRDISDEEWDVLLIKQRDTQIEFDLVKELLLNGEAIQYHVTKQNESIIKATGFTIQFEGLTFLACNHARYNSHLFTAGLTEEHDACFGFNWDGKQWRISLYHAPGKEHHDLSVIAVKNGGGGHRGACGFRTKHLDFLS